MISNDRSDSPACHNVEDELLPVLQDSPLQVHDDAVDENDYHTFRHGHKQAKRDTFRSAQQSEKHLDSQRQERRQLSQREEQENHHHLQECRGQLWIHGLQ
jgi:hypothetical protein